MIGGFYSQRANVQFISIEKNACTTVKATLLATDGINCKDGYDAHCHQRWRSLPDDWLPSLIFAVVRHPFDRLVSAFAEKLRTGKAASFNCPLDRDAPFAAWCDWVCNQPPTAADRHWKPQSLILERQAAIHGFDLGDVDLLRFESLKAAWQAMQHKAPLLFGLVDDGRRGEGSIRNASPSRQPWPEYYRDADTIEQVASFYADDMAAFLYGPPPKPDSPGACRCLVDG